MPEYIEREALGIGKCNPDVFENKGYAEGWNSAVEIMMKAPTADVVEVVRCKDCKKWDETRRFGISCACSHWSPSIKDCRFTLPDGFCSEGIRKEGAEE